MNRTYIRLYVSAIAAIVLLCASPRVALAADTTTSQDSEEETINSTAANARDITDGNSLTQSISSEVKVRYYKYKMAESTSSDTASTSTNEESGYVRFIFTPGSDAGKYSSWVVAALDTKQKGDPQKVTETYYSDPIAITSGKSVYLRISRPANAYSDDVTYTVKAEFSKEEEGFITPETKSDTATSEVTESQDEIAGKALARQTIKGISINDFDKKGLSIRWRKISGVSGYQIKYSSNKKLTGAKSDSSKKAKVTLKGVGKGKSVYVKVRAYIKTDSGKKYYSKWSKVKEVKTSGIVM